MAISWRIGPLTTTIAAIELVVRDPQSTEVARLPVTNGFAYDSGSYTRGQVSFPVPDLADGSYRFTLTALDNFGNSTGSDTDVEIATNPETRFHDVFAYPNPFDAETDVVFTLDHSLEVSIPPTGTFAIALLVTYGAILITSLFFYNRAVTARDNRLLQSALSAREATARRTEAIAQELKEVRERLGKVEPTEQVQAEEIRELQRERQILRGKLADLADREAELRRSAARSIELDQERLALEELLEEASEDLTSKEEEIQDLQARLKTAAKNAGDTRGGGRTRALEQLSRRMRTLYKTVEFDDRVIHDLLALRDETMKLKAEEAIKRLADGSDAAAIRRKVGGLPPHLSIFELGFAGKGRVYYTRGRQRSFRVLSVGAKNTQNADLEYLSRLPA